MVFTFNMCLLELRSNKLYSYLNSTKINFKKSKNTVIA